MKRINEMQDGTLRSSPSAFTEVLLVEPASLARPTLSIERKLRRTRLRRTQSSRRSRLRAAAVTKYWSVGVLHFRESHLVARNFCGLSLELFARPVMNNETVLPKAAVTAGKIILRLNLGVASAALRDAATISLERRVVSKQ